MEQLKQAILQAEKRLAKASLAPGGERESRFINSRSELPNQVNVKSEPPSTPSEIEISYRETKVVSLDASVLEKNRVLTSSSSNEVVQAYKVLRTQVLQKLKLNHWNSLAVVSPRTGNGKTLTSVNLAISLAQEVKNSVLLVDFDFRSPSVATTLGMNEDKGVSDYLLRDEQISDVLVNPSIERLVVLPGYEQLSHSSEALASPKMISLVDELHKRYPNRIVIYDLPPILESDDVIAFAPYVDSLLMVIEEASTTPEDLQCCAEMIGDKPLLGSVLNKANA